MADFRDFRGKKAVITGAKGFIGSCLARSLLTVGAEIYALETSKWSVSNLKNILAKISPELIFHLRAQISQNIDIKETNSFYRINVEETKNLVEAANLLGGLEAFIHVGTIAEYGSVDAPFKEEGPARPISEYGKSKLEATLWVQALSKKTNFPARIIRPSPVYGPEQKPHSFLIPNLILNCIKNQNIHISSRSMTRDPLFIQDAAEGLMMAALSEKANGEIINIGLGKEYAIIDIANIINNFFGNKAKIIVDDQGKRAGESEHYWQDIAKAKQILNWEPKTTLMEGLAKTIAWYEEHRHQFI